MMMFLLSMPFGARGVLAGWVAGGVPLFLAVSLLLKRVYRLDLTHILQVVAMEVAIFVAVAGVLLFRF